MVVFISQINIWSTNYEIGIKNITSLERSSMSNQVFYPVKLLISELVDITLEPKSWFWSIQTLGNLGPMIAPKFFESWRIMLCDHTFDIFPLHWYWWL